MTINDSQLVSVILGAVVLAALGVIAYALKSRNEDARQLAILFAPLVESVRVAVDRQLAPLGPQLTPLHDALVQAESAFDDPDDYLVKLIQRPAVTAAILSIIQAAKALTDGVPADADDVPKASYGVPEPDSGATQIPEQEHIPPGGAREAVK